VPAAIIEFAGDTPSEGTLCYYRTQKLSRLQRRSLNYFATLV